MADQDDAYDVCLYYISKEKDWREVPDPKGAPRPGSCYNNSWERLLAYLTMT